MVSQQPLAAGSERTRAPVAATCALRRGRGTQPAPQRAAQTSSCTHRPQLPTTCPGPTGPHPGGRL